jgi:hypothetical protein
MRKQIINCTLTSFLALFVGTVAHAQSGAYYNAVTSLHPFLYLPLTETAQPPGTTIATNYGTLGQVDNGVYNQGAFPGVPGAIVGDTAAEFAVDSDATMFANYDSAYASLTNFTIEFWINSAVEDPGEDSVINCLDAAAPRNGWQIYTDGNEAGSFNFRTYYDNSTVPAINYNILIPGGHLLANTWYYVVVTYNGATATAQGYINGTATSGNATSTTSPTYTTSQAGPFVLGGRSDNSFFFYPGAMAEAAFYSGLLSPSAISNHYYAGTNGVAGAYYTVVSNAQPLLWFRLNENELPIATNYGTAGASAVGYYQSGTTPGSAGPGYSGFGAAGVNAVQFQQGEAEYNGATVLVPGASLLPIGRTANSPITVSAWVLVPYDPGAFSTVLGKGDSSYRFDIGAASDGGAGNPHWNAGNFGDIDYAADLGDNSWHFWVGTWDGSNTMTLYIDGKQVGQTTDDTINTFNNNVLDIGAAPDYTGRNFDGGSLSQVAIFTNALSQSQIVSLFFASGVTGVPPVITQQPQDVVGALGSNVTLTVSALGFQPLSYQWYSNGVAVGANSTSFTINAATTNADGFYYVVVTDGEATPEMTTSSNAQVEIVAPLAGSYYAAVTALGPVGYWPLNETNQPTSMVTPIATNYGLLGTNDNGFYLPGTYPGSVPGPKFAGFPGGLTNVAVAFNNSNWVSGGVTGSGSAGFVDVPVDANDSLNIVGSMTLAAWLQAQPNDGKFETALGRGDDSYRFSVDGTSSNLLHFADVGGDLDGVAPAGLVNDGKWHFVVATYNGSQEILYVDGVPNAVQSETGTAPGEPLDFTIGEAPDYGGLRGFDGNIAEVAIYNYPLSSSQVQSLYYAADIPAFINTEPPASITVSVNTTTNISVVASGTPALSYKWSTNNGSSLLTGTNFSGTTTSTLTISPALVADSATYVVVVSNAYGSVTSTPAVLTVSAAPLLTAFPATNYVLLGTTLTLAVGETGTGPITNAWYANGVKLANGTLSTGAIVSGATNATLIISNVQAANAGTYTLYATNLNGTSSVTGTVVVDLEPQIRDTGSYSIATTRTPYGQSLFKGVVNNGVLQLASEAAADYEATSFWFNQPCYIGAFEVHFAFSNVINDLGGVCFCIQNSAMGTNACGDCGQALGVGEWLPYTQNAITYSWEFEIDDNADEFAFDTNGVASPEVNPNGPTGYQIASPEFPLGDFGMQGNNPSMSDYWITYLGTNLTVTYSNELTGSTATYVTNVQPDFIQSAVKGSNSAYIGFTAGTWLYSLDSSTGEGLVAEADSFYISKFSYTPIIMLSITKTNSGGVVLNWPTGVGGYSLQVTTNLAATTWTTLPVPYATNSSGMYQYVAQPATGNEYYRLVLP